jgi:outer membrane receptor protein involved in Fe transport
MGFFAVVRATYYNQTVDQFDDLTSSTRSSIDSEFTIGDLGVGYRLPKRWGTVALNAFNITDREFDFYRSSLEEDIVPARTIALTVNFASP